MYVCMYVCMICVLPHACEDGWDDVEADHVLASVCVCMCMCTCVCVCGCVCVYDLCAHSWM